MENKNILLGLAAVVGAIFIGKKMSEKEEGTGLSGIKKKLPKYQFGVGRRTIHIEAKDLKSAKKKAEKWRDKNAKNSVLAYDFRVD